MSADDSHGAGVSQSDLVGIIAADAHRVQVPEVGALGDTTVLHVLTDLLIHCLQELITDVVADRHSLTCSGTKACCSVQNPCRPPYSSDQEQTSVAAENGQ